MDNLVDLTVFISKFLDDLGFEEGSGYFYKKDSEGREARIYIEDEGIKFINYNKDEKFFSTNSGFEDLKILKEIKYLSDENSSIDLSSRDKKWDKLYESLKPMMDTLRKELINKGFKPTEFERNEDSSPIYSLYTTIKIPREDNKSSFEFSFQPTIEGKIRVFGELYIGNKAITTTLAEKIFDTSTYTLESMIDYIGNKVLQKTRKSLKNIESSYGVTFDEVNLDNTSIKLSSKNKQRIINLANKVRNL